MKKGYSFNLRENGYYQIIYQNPETGKRERKSLGTTDGKLAEILAEKHWKDVLDDYDRGILVQDKSLAKIYREYFDTEKCLYNKDTIKRHFMPYLDEKNIKIANLKQHTIDEYYKWRKTQTFRGKTPNDITLNRENCAIKSFLNFCTKKHYLTPKRTLELQHNDVVPNRRKPFSIEQMKEILERSKSNYENTIKSDLRAERKCMYQIVKFLAITGMRDGSALGLLWSDLYLGEVKPYIYIQANNNKTRKYVKITISNTLRDKLRAFREEQKQFCHKHNIEFSDDMNVFNVMHEYKYPKEDGTTGVIYPTKSFRKSWNTMIKQCSFYKEGEDYAPYRIRHYKITSLMAKKELSAEQIAKYCCTSPDMIKDFYDATETLDFCEEFAEAEKIVEYNKGNDDITSDNDDFQTDECKIIPFPFAAN